MDHAEFLTVPKRSRSRKRKRTPQAILKPTNSTQWTFPKSKRFRLGAKAQTDSFYDVSYKWGSGQSASMGLGDRWFPQNARGKDAPPPTTYTLSSQLGRHGRAFSSVPRSSYKPRSETPGPGSYELGSFIGKAKKFSISGRTQSTYRRKEGPDPGSYNPRYSLVQPSRYSKISMSKNARSDIVSSRPSTPGPGAYNLHRRNSIC